MVHEDKRKGHKMSYFACQRFFETCFKRYISSLSHASKFFVLFYGPSQELKSCYEFKTTCLYSVKYVDYIAVQNRIKYQNFLLDCIYVFETAEKWLVEPETELRRL